MYLLGTGDPSLLKTIMSTPKSNFACGCKIFNNGSINEMATQSICVELVTDAFNSGRHGEESATTGQSVSRDSGAAASEANQIQIVYHDPRFVNLLPTARVELDTSVVHSAGERDHDMGCTDMKHVDVLDGSSSSGEASCGSPPSDVPQDGMEDIAQSLPPAGNTLAAEETPTMLAMDDFLDPATEQVNLPPMVSGESPHTEAITTQDIEELPVVPAAPEIEFDTLCAELAARELRQKLQRGELKGDYTDPPCKEGLLPRVFKVRNVVPWYKRWYRLLCGCCIDVVPKTRRYQRMEDIVLNLVECEDVRLTAGLSHTMLRCNPRLVRYAVRNYDQFDVEMESYHIDPVTFEKRESPTDRCIDIPVVLLEDLCAKYDTDSVTPSLISQMYDSLIRVVNVPFNHSLSLKSDFVMFCLDFLMWRRDWRKTAGLENFQSTLLT